jgi:hypothetical protein
VPEDRVISDRVDENDPTVEDSWFHPPVLNCPGERASWVAAVAPRGARALRCHPYGVWEAIEEYVLPLTDPPRFDHPPSHGEPTDWLARVLTHMRNGRAPFKPSVIDNLVAMLAPGPRHDDGLPAYWPAEPNVKQTHLWMAESKRDGAAGRRVLTAVAFDLHGHDLAHISSAMLRLHDQEVVPPGQGAVDREGGDPRNARRYLSAGRGLLAGLGVWPWTHAPRGRLPIRWYEADAFVEPLWRWHRGALDEIEGECRLARSAWGASVTQWESGAAAT